MIEIPLTRGMVALIDDEDYGLISDRRWHARPDCQTFYASARWDREDGRASIINMHTVLMGGTRTGMMVDHINGDGLDNRRHNLRWATPSQQAQNRARPITNTSGFKGVCLVRKTGRWVAKIKLHGLARHIGVYGTPEAAARAYDAKAVELFGEFARLNFPFEECATS